MCTQGVFSLSSSSSFPFSLEKKEPTGILYEEKEPLILPEDFFDKEKAKALFFDKHTVQGVSFSFIEFFKSFKGIPTLAGSFANHLVLDSITYKDIDFKVTVEDIDKAIEAANFFLKERNIEGVFTKFVSYGKKISEINANLELSCYVDFLQKEIKVDIVLVQQKRRETLFDGFGFQLETFNGEEECIVPSVLKGNQKSFEVEELLKLKRSLLDLNLNITDPINCNKASLKRSVDSLSKGYLLNSESRQEQVAHFFSSNTFIDKEFDGISLSMSLQQNKIEALEETDPQYKEKIEKRMVFLMNTVFLFLEHSENSRERYKETTETNILRESGFKCFEEMYKRLQLSNKLLAKHPIFKYLQRFHSKVLERWIHLFNEIALQYLSRGILIKGVNICFKKEGEDIFVCMTFSENASFWFKLRTRTEEQSLETKTYLALHFPQACFEEGSPPSQGAELKSEDSKVYEKILLKAKKSCVFSWYISRALENTVSDGFLLFLIQKGIALFKGAEREAFFLVIIENLEKKREGSFNREKIILFLRRSKGDREVAFLELLDGIEPFFFNNLEESSPNFWLSFFKTDEEALFKRALEIIWPKVRQVHQKEIACTFFLSWKEKLGDFLIPFLGDLENHFQPLSEEESQILKPFKRGEPQKAIQKQNPTKSYQGLNGAQRYSEFGKMNLLQKVANFPQFLSYIKQDKVKGGVVFFDLKLKELWQEFPSLAAQFLVVFPPSFLNENAPQLEEVFKANPKIIYYLFQYPFWALPMAELVLFVEKSFSSEFKELAFIELLNNGKYEEATRALQVCGSKINTKVISKNFGEKWDSCDLTNPVVFECMILLLKVMHAQDFSEEKESSVNSVIRKIERKKASKVKTPQQGAKFLKELEDLLKAPFVSTELKSEIYEKMYRGLVQKFFQKPLEQNELNNLFDSKRGKYLSRKELEQAFKNGSFKVKQKITNNYREQIEKKVLQESIVKFLQNKAFSEALELFILYCKEEESGEKFVTFSDWKNMLLNELNKEKLFQGLALYEKISGDNGEACIELLKKIYKGIQSTNTLLLFVIQVPGLVGNVSSYELIESLLRDVSEEDLGEEEQGKINTFLIKYLPVIYKSKKKAVDAFFKEEIILKGQPDDKKWTLMYLEKVPFYAYSFLSFFQEKLERIEDEELAFLIFRFKDNKKHIKIPINICKKAFDRVNNQNCFMQRTIYVQNLYILMDNIKNGTGSMIQEPELRQHLNNILPIIMKTWNNIPISSLASLAGIYPEYCLPHISPIFELKNREKFWNRCSDTFSFWTATLTCLTIIQESNVLKKEYESFFCENIFGEESSFFKEVVSTDQGRDLKARLLLLTRLYLDSAFSRRLKQLMDSRIEEIEKRFAFLLKRYVTENFTIEDILDYIQNFGVVSVLFYTKKYGEYQEILKKCGITNLNMVFPKGMGYHSYQRLLQSVQNGEPIITGILKELKTNQEHSLQFLERAFSLENVIGSIRNGKSLREINNQLGDVLEKVLLEEIPPSPYQQELSVWKWIAQENAILPVEKNLFEGLNFVQSFLMIEKSCRNKKYYKKGEGTVLISLIIEEILSWKNQPFIKGTEGEAIFWLAVTKPIFEKISKEPSNFNSWFSGIYQHLTSNKYEAESKEGITTLFEIPEIDVLADWLEFGLLFLEPLLSTPSLETDSLESKTLLSERSLAVNNFKEFLRDMGAFYIKSIQYIAENDNVMTSLGLEKIKRFHDVIISAFDHLRRHSEDLFVSVLKNWKDQLFSGNLIKNPKLNADLFLPLLTLELTTPNPEEKIHYSFEEYFQESFKEILTYTAVAEDIEESFKRTGREYPKDLIREVSKVLCVKKEV